MRRWYSRLSLRSKISGIALLITTMSVMVVGDMTISSRR